MSDVDQPECFIIMPISDQPGYPVGHFGRVFRDIIRPACEQAGFKPVRADEVTETNLIHLDVIRRIIESPMAVCDLSSRNPNVLFELGIRQAFDKPVALIRDPDTPDIFDIAPLRYTTYRKDMIYNEVLEDQSKIEVAIRSTSENSRGPHNVNSIVKLLSISKSAEISDNAALDYSSVLQIVQAEVGQLRSDIVDIGKSVKKLLDNSSASGFYEHASNVGSGLKALREALSAKTASDPLTLQEIEDLTAMGLVSFMRNKYGFRESFITELLEKSDTFIEFMRALGNSPDTGYKFLQLIPSLTNDKHFQFAYERCKQR